MTSWTFRAGLLLTSAVVAGAAIASQTSAVTLAPRGAPPTADTGEVAQLFDPAYVARSLCGAHGQKLGEFVKPRLVLAAAAAGGETAEKAEEQVPLWDFLGDLSYPITTRDELAQRYFDQGLRWSYAFNHAEAIRAFRQAQRIDPTCAMCYWGEAYALGPNINAPMDEAAVEPAFAAISKAQALAGNATERERALIAATAERYSPDPRADRAALDAAYADAMAEAAAEFPDDHEIASLYAEAVMDLSPWDYWEADAATPKGQIGAAIAAVEGVLAEEPDHPFAIHLYIHLVEASTTPERAEPYADRLGAAMRGAGHMVHMPAHIYFRLGRYLDSLASNYAAVAADEYFFERVGDAAGPLSLYGYYPHNVHFLVESARLAGDKAASLEAAEKLEPLVPDEVADAVAWLQAVKASPYFAYAQFGDPEAVLSIPDPAGLPFVRGAWHYARGVAEVGAGDIEAARAQAEAIAEIAALDEVQALPAAGMPGPDVLRIAQLVLDGRIAQAEGDPEAAIAAFEEAAEVQDALPYMEPPFWYYPVRQSLGAALLQAGEAAEAERVFQRSLLDFPNNAWALYGLMEAQKAQGDTAGAAQTEALFERAWAGEDADLDLSRL